MFAKGTEEEEFAKEDATFRFLPLPLLQTQTHHHRSNLLLSCPASACLSLDSQNNQTREQEPIWQVGVQILPISSSGDPTQTYVSYTDTGESGAKETDANVCPPEWPRASLLWAKDVWGGVIRLLSEFSIKIHFFVK